MAFNRPKTFDELSSPSRRRFVLGAASAGAMMALGGLPGLVQAKSRPQDVVELSGRTIDLNIGYQKVNITGTERTATTINGSMPAPVLRLKEGQRVTLNVANGLSDDTSIHWHGLILPENMDGVPGISFDGIKPGESYKYEFDVVQNGTYWYHSHSGFQEQTGHYGPIIIEPKDGYPYKFDREHVVMLSDWTDEDPEDIYAKLKKLSHYYNFSERTTGDLVDDIQQKGLSQTMADREMWNNMRMSDRDISDVTGYTYTFLMNGVTPDDGWVGQFKKGEKVLLRFINAAAMTFFDVRIPGLKMTVVAADGQYVKPVSVDEFRIGVAETYDVIVEPEDNAPYTVFAQSIDRSGYARGTLTPDPALRAEVPAMDAKPILTHGDMGMGHHGMHGGGHNMGGDMDHSGHNMGGNNSSGGMDHSGHNMGGGMEHRNHKMNTQKRRGSLLKVASNGMDHSGHNMGGGMDHSGHSMGTTKSGSKSKYQMGSGLAGYGSAAEITHAKEEYGPHVDMRAETPQYRMDDPGIGLRDHKEKLGRKVLTYADLRNLYPTPDKRQPDREIELHLTGNMSRYMWSINGVKFADAEPLQLNYGERVRITLVNDTMMNHPMHLHGMWSDLETGDHKYIPRKHTVIVQPGAKISYLVTADAKGSWAYHCHLVYHMMGMFRKVTVS
ncbi:MAG: copper resistance system multicopper oxidase [Gammaproteobacteria bacterium]|nr:copper resistance system multicopper oxidase [Gammaproteobacteria bacterium]